MWYCFKSNGKKKYQKYLNSYWEENWKFKGFQISSLGNNNQWHYIRYSIVSIPPSQGLGRPCTIGTSKSIVAHWGLLSMRSCTPCTFWLIILLFHVSIKVVFYFVSWFYHCLHSSLISLFMFRTVICVNQSDKRIHSFDSKYSVFKTHLSWRFVLFSE